MIELVVFPFNTDVSATSCYGYVANAALIVVVVVVVCAIEAFKLVEDVPGRSHGMLCRLDLKIGHVKNHLY